MENYIARNFPYKSSPLPMKHKPLQHFRSLTEHRNVSNCDVTYRSTPPSNRRRIKSDPGSSLREGNLSNRPKRASSFTEYRERRTDRNKNWRSKSVSACQAITQSRNNTDTIRTVSRSVDYHLPCQDSDSTKSVVDKWRSYKRILFKQISDSAILSRRRPRMTQESQQMEKMSPERRQSAEKKPENEAENSPSRVTTKSKALKQLQHPRKKFVRTQSESAIDVSNIRSRKISQPCGTDLKGIVCSNDDLKKILMDAKRVGFSRQRNNTITSPSKFEILPELKETSFDRRLSGRRRSPPPDLNVTWARSPRKVHSVDLIDSPVKSSPKLRRPSPKGSPVAKPKDVEISCPHSTTSSSTFLVSCESCRDERTKMLHHEDENCNVSCSISEQSIQEEKEEESEVTVSDPLAGLAASIGGFDPQLLGEAIERRLALADKPQPQRKSPVKTIDGKHSPQSFRALWGQNNTQLSNRIGNLVSKFPFKKDVTQAGTSGISV
ncbi:uncharacterized protein [Apostichopus japonicus]|uniref:uncharacterized protein isoform X2 n=1 Tax=Stichopus japonicus TaxID=307972 RepID=UPI003AB6C977